MFNLIIPNHLLARYVLFIFFDFGKITKVAIIPFVFIYFIYVVLDIVVNDNSLCISVSSLSFSYCRGLWGLKEVKKHHAVSGMDQPRNLFSELWTCSARDVPAQWTIVCSPVGV